MQPSYWQTVGKWCAVLGLAGVAFVFGKSNPSDYYLPALYGWALMFPFVLLFVGFARFLARRKGGQEPNQ